MSNSFPRIDMASSIICTVRSIADRLRDVLRATVIGPYVRDRLLVSIQVRRTQYLGDTAMQYPMRPLLRNPVSAFVAIGGAVLAIGLAVTEVSAQTTAAPPARTAQSSTDEAQPTNAQLQEQIRELRKQVAQLQHAQKESIAATSPPNGGMITDKQGNKKCKEGMKMGMAADGQKGCMGMPDSSSTKDSPGKPMKQGGMGMMEKDDSMAPSPPASDTPKDPAAPMKPCCG
jgi:hypothetical protein